MVKIKDFKLASKNRGGTCPPSSYTTPAMIASHNGLRLSLFKQGFLIYNFCFISRMNIAEIEFLAERERITINPTFTSESYKFIEVYFEFPIIILLLRYTVPNHFPPESFSTSYVSLFREKWVHFLLESRLPCRFGSRSI